MVDAALRIPAPVLARFSAAEARLYPLAVVDPDSYRGATTLVGLVVDDLRDRCRDIDSVLACRETLMAALPTIAERAGLALASLPPDSVVDAASAVRCRELQAEGARAAAQARIEAARAAGQEWLVEEPDPAAVMAGSYRRVERHLPTGATIVATMEAGGGFEIELIPDGDCGASQTGRYRDRGAWLAAVQQVRAALSTGRQVRIDH